MALTDENSGGFVATMPMAPAYGGGYGGGFGNGMGGDGRTHGSATAHKQAALQRNDPQNSRLTKAKGEPKKFGSFFFRKFLYFFIKSC